MSTKLTFCLSPLITAREYSVANRILTSNLLNNEKIEAYFNYTFFEAFLKSSRVCDEKFNDLKKVNYPLSVGYYFWRGWMRMMIANHLFKEKFVDSIKTDIVLFSCLTGVLDFPYLITLLNKGFRVVAGGGFFLDMLPNKYYTDILLRMGLKESKLKNLIIVKGYVDYNTDLKKIIDEWRDFNIEQTDFSSFWNCHEDYISKIIKSISVLGNMEHITENLKENYVGVNFMLNNKCFWGKCKFCTYRMLKKFDTVKEGNIDNIVRNINQVAKSFKTNRIRFTDDYFVFTEKNKKILSEIQKYDSSYRLSISTGIRLLKDEEYIDNINKYKVKYMMVGVESGTDFSLEYMNKGIRVSDIDEAINKIGDRMENDVEIRFNLISDMPQKSEKEILLNYENIARWKKHLKDRGFSIQCGGTKLALTKHLTENCIDEKYIRRCENDKSLSGRNHLFKQIEKVIGEDVFNKGYYETYIPFNRYDEDGKLLRADLEIIPEDLNKYLWADWGW